MCKIIDVIIERHDPLPDSIYVILDKKPKFKYVEVLRPNVHHTFKTFLEARYRGFYDCYGLEYVSKKLGSHWQAFGGREFEIPMKDGTVIKAHGQWWDTGCQGMVKTKLIRVGYSTIEALENCYVFSAGTISEWKLKQWLKKNKPSNNYWKYDKRKKNV